MTYAPSAIGGTTFLAAGRSVAAFDGERMEVDPVTLPRLPSVSTHVRTELVGDWPNAPFLRIAIEERDSREDLFFARAKSGSPVAWNPVTATRKGSPFFAVAPWASGAAVALERCDDRTCRSSFTLRDLAGSKVIAEFASVCPKDSCTPIASAMSGMDEGFVLVSEDTSDVMAARKRGTWGSGTTYSVVRFAAGRVPSKQTLFRSNVAYASDAPLQVVSSKEAYVVFYVEPSIRIYRFQGTRWEPLALPSKEWDMLSVRAIGSGGVYARVTKDGTTGLVRFDPKDGPVGRWTPETLPGSIVQMDGEKFGTPWALVEKGERTVPFRRETDGTWTEIAMPRSAREPETVLEPSTLRVVGKGDAWITAEAPEDGPRGHERSLTAVLRSRPVARTLRCRTNVDADDDESAEVPPSLVDWPPPAGATCATPYVVFGTLEDLELDDRIVVAARDALADTNDGVTGTHAVLDTFEVGKVRYLGARASSPSDLAKLRETKLLESGSPEVVCGSPENVIASRTVDVVRKLPAIRGLAAR